MTSLLKKIYSSLLQENEDHMFNHALLIGSDKFDGQMNKFYSDLNKEFVPSYANSQNHTDDVVKHPLLRKIDQNIKLPITDLWAIVKKNPTAILAIDPTRLDQELVDYALEQNPELIALVDKNFITTKNAVAAIESNPLLIEFIPEELKTYKLVNKAISGDLRAIKYTPDSLVSEDILNRLYHAKEYILDYVPFKWWKDVLIINQSGIDSNRTMISTINISVANNESAYLLVYLEALRNKENVDGILGDLDSAIYHSELFIRVVDYDLRAFPQVLRLFDKEKLHLINLQTCVEVGSLTEVADQHWDMLYSSIYDHKSLLGFKIPNKFSYLSKKHYKFWINVWLSLPDEVKEVTPIPSYYITADIIEDSDLWAKIYDKRHLTELLMSNEIEKLENLQSINPDNTSIAELQKSANLISEDVIHEAFKFNPYFFFLLPQKNKDLKSAISLIQEYPYLIKTLPTNLLEIEGFENEIRKANREALSYLNRS